MFSKLFSTLKIWRVEKFTILFFKLKSLYRISWFYSKAKIITAGICIFLIKVYSCSVENIQILYTMDCALVNFKVGNIFDRTFDNICIWVLDSDLYYEYFLCA